MKKWCDEEEEERVECTHQGRVELYAAGGAPFVFRDVVVDGEVRGGLVRGGGIC